MKLLYITNGITGSGGLERVLSIKASLLAEDYGYDVTILGLNNGNDTPFYEFSSKIKFRSIPVSGNIYKYIKQYKNGIRGIVDEIQPDVISVCDDGLKAFFLPLILKKNQPIIYERHVSKEIEMNVDFPVWKKAWIHFKWKLMAKLANRFSKFVVLTNGNVEEWKHLTNIEVIPNPTSFYPETTAQLTNKIVIAVGKQGYQKGYDRLLKSWQLVLQQHPDWRLEIYGKSDPEQKLSKQASKLGIKESVYFFEPIKDIQSKYLESSVYVMSSRFEGFGMVLIEAMACGVPCVSFDCPHGPADIINNGKDGFLVNNGDVVALAEALNKLISNKTLRKEMGANAKINVKRYLPVTIVNEWDQLFKDLIG